MKHEHLSIFDRFPQLQNIPKEKYPKHILIIPDGNGRWAKQRNKLVTEGHRKGAAVVEILLEDIADIHEISAVTIWGFAADNWKRSEKEVRGLLFLITTVVKKTLNKLKERDGRFIHLGRKDRLPKELVGQFANAEEDTYLNKGQILSLAIDFGGEDQNIRVVEKARTLPIDIPTTLDMLWELRDGRGIVKSADLIIRTSGEKRTSDIGWLNGSSSELYFIDKLFPDITTADIVEAFVDFSKRKRRFGGREENKI